MIVRRVHWSGLRIAACMTAFGIPAGIVNLLVSPAVRAYADLRSVVVLDVVLCAIAWLLWSAPWERWPERTQLVVLACAPVITIATDRVYGYSAARTPVDGTILFVVSTTLWIGFTQRPNLVAVLAVVAAAPVLAHDGMRNGAGNVLPAVGMLVMTVVAAQCISVSRARELALLGQLHRVAGLSQRFDVTVARERLLEHLAQVVTHGLGAHDVRVVPYDDAGDLPPAGGRRIDVVVIPTVGPELRVGATLSGAIPQNARRSFQLLVGEILGRFVEQHHGVTERLRTDPLTHLGNRIAADEALERLRPGDAVVLLDVDHFKYVNDTFGHASGDAILRQVARFLRSVLRSSDELCRFGGDELLVVLHGTTDAPGAVRAILERWGAQHPPVSLSAGLAVCGPDEPGSDVLRRADDALYLAKKSGRARLCVA